MHNTVSQLSRTLAEANRFISAQLEKHGLAGIAPSHGDILVQLFENEQLPMSELAQRIGRDPSTVTALVKKLVAEGYLLTAKQPDDKRIVLVSLTEKGKLLQPAFDQVSTSLEHALCCNLGEHDLQELDRLLSTIKENFETAQKGESL